MPAGDAAGIAGAIAEGSAGAREAAGAGAAAGASAGDGFSAAAGSGAGRWQAASPRATEHATSQDEFRRIHPRFMPPSRPKMARV